MRDLALITGQMPVKTKANKSIASFKLREGATVGIDVTRRGNQCNAFLSGSAYKPGSPWDQRFPRCEPQQFGWAWKLQHRIL
ncbi:hypothetical protein OPV22_001203 [Ensete ventricosum]|uniref:Large ribosomal subunit protein uL5 N-terminal domain-containing protein n=1 Tax=Ensete ventricosum TaxID=4639 RepID=A0AAV8RKT0_ENSVE|nr:hypothetical protein OPV22_001203 [Ensete ventricosum]